MAAIKPLAANATVSDSLVCIFCRCRVPFSGDLPAADLEDHLLKEHNVQFDAENVVQRTLMLQRPNLLVDKFVEAGVQVELESNSTGSYEKRLLPWFAGCEYRCQKDDCGEMFFYNQDLRAHVKKVHGSPNEYLDKYAKFETKVVNLKCRECGEDIKRHFSSVFNHVKVHGLSLEEYKRKHKMRDYYVKVKVKAAADAAQPPQSAVTTTSTATMTTLTGSVLENIPFNRLKRPAGSVDGPEGGSKRPRVAEKPGCSWFHGCEYKCQICPDIMYYDVHRLIGHLRTRHQMDSSTYQSVHGKLETRTALYKCKLCEGRVKQTRLSISNHLSAVHDGMKLDAYQEIFHPIIVPAGAVDSSGATPGPAAPTSVEDEKAEAEAAFKKWSVGTCEFTCNACPFKSNGSVDFWKHAKNEHGLDIPTYKAEHGNPCTTMNKIACKICSKVLRYDYGTLLGHASMKHNKTLRAFYDENYADKSPPPVADKLPGNKSTPPGACVEGRSVRHLASDDIKKRAHMWAWKCRFRCKMCQASFSSLVGSQKHINGAHKMVYADYEREHGSIMVRKVHFTCQLCGQVQLHDPCTIQRHMKISHNSSLVAYFAEFVDGGKTVHLPDGDQVTLAAGEVAPAALVEQPTTTIVRRIQPSGMAADAMRWANACEYSCALCPYTSMNKSTFGFHVRSSHKMMPSDYKVKYPNSEVVKNHACKVCGVEIRWRGCNIRGHLKVHKMRLEDYYAKYIVDEPDFVDVAGEPKGREWTNRCVFECAVCRVSFPSRSTFQGHVSEVHELTLEMYEQTFGRPIVEMDLHCCLMCQEMVTCDEQDIAEHLETAHSLSLDDYHDRYMANDRMVTTPRKPIPLCWDWDRGAGLMHECLICSMPVEMSHQNMETHLKVHSIDLRTYEKSYPYKLDEVFSSLGDGRLEENVLDDDDLGSLYEDDGVDAHQQNPSYEIMGVDPLAADDSAVVDDIPDIDIEDNVDYISNENY